MDGSIRCRAQSFQSCLTIHYNRAIQLYNVDSFPEFADVGTSGTSHATSNAATGYNKGPNKIDWLSHGFD